MEIRTRTGVNPTQTITLEGNEQVYPCRCGEIHRGDYAIYEYGHHNCYHDSVLVIFNTPGISSLEAFCPQCGQMFGLEYE